MARRHKRLWTAEDKRSICFQTTAPGVSVAQVARRYALNANLLFKWLRDPRFAPSPQEEGRFVPVELIDAPGNDCPSVASGRDDRSRPRAGDTPDAGLEIDLSCGHRLRVSGAYDAERLAVLLRRLSS